MRSNRVHVKTDIEGRRAFTGKLQFEEARRQMPVSLATVNRVFYSHGLRRAQVDFPLVTRMLYDRNCTLCVAGDSATPYKIAGQSRIIRQRPCK